jgi:hypothetical protein
MGGIFHRYTVGDRDTTKLIFDIIAEILHQAINEGDLNRNDAKVIYEEMEANIGVINDDLYNFLRQGDTTTENELVEFCGKEINKFINAIKRSVQNSNNNRGRQSAGFSRNTYNGNGLKLTDRRGGSSRIFGLAGGGDDKYNQDPDEVESRKTSRLASEASNRSRERERQIGVGRVRDNTSVEPPIEIPKPKAVQPGVMLSEDYACVESLSATECTIQVTPHDAGTAENMLYEEMEHGAILADGAISIDFREIEINCPFMSVTNVINMLRWSDSMMFNPEAYCHIVHFPKLSFAPMPRMGDQLLEAGHAIKKLYMENNGRNTPDILADMSAALNQCNPTVRTVIQARLLKRWNTVAKCLFPIPEAPNDYLAATSWEHLMRFFSINSSSTAITDPILQSIKTKVDGFIKMCGKEYSSAVSGVMNHCLASLYDDEYGFLDLRKKNLEYLTSWDACPICVDKKYRPRDLGKMTDDQKKALGGMFHQDYICFTERMSFMVTNLKLDDMLVHPTVNHILAGDIPSGQVLKSLSINKDYHHLLYSIPQIGATPQYVAHVGASMNRALQMVRLQDSY